MSKRFTQDQEFPEVFHSTREVNEEIIAQLEQIIRLIRADGIHAGYPSWILRDDGPHPHMETDMEQETDDMIVRVEVGTDPGTLIIRKEA